MLAKLSLLFILIPFFLFSQIKSYNDVIAKELQKKAVEYKTEINFIKSQSFYLKQDWDSTLIYSMKQLSLNPNNEIANYCHFFRGTSFFEKKLYKETKNEMIQISNQFVFFPQARIILAGASLELRDFEKAGLYYENALKFPQISKQPYSLSKIYEGLGMTYIFLKKYDKAEEYLIKNLKIKEKDKDKDNLYNAYNSIANLYYVQYKDQQAIPYFEKAYDLSNKTNKLDLKYTASKNMAVVEENRNNFKQALAYRKESEQWKDSVNDQNKVWAVADFEKKFAVSQKQKQIKVLEVENKLKNSQRNWLFFSAIGLLLLLTSGIYLYAQKVKNAKIILIQKNKLDELNATKDQLFSIVSHDLRSSVNALKTSNAKLSATLETKNYEELNQLIIQNSGIANGTYSLLDNLLHWALLQTKQLYFHKESVHLFSIVQQIEYNYKPLLLDKSITFENSVSKNCFIFVDIDSLKIVLRNLLDNAIKFSNENGKISFYIQEENPESCQLVLQDTGLGMNEDTIAAILKDDELLAKKGKSEAIGTGLGMQLCKQMVKKNGGTIQIESELNKGTKIILTFPKTEQNG
ncbi:MAG: tetratricopeptide repeat-containing sensor histidine kinase [Flavobacterium sp.]|uniref:tetratricopeptide repeat-containing sensor histidine kinase n=1 Tax=Flavobacterium sp. TaxID=239 RepID=UPI00261CB1E7|nr:tetratricopeptide repeat-containing sensor histidine kinase [Flavobacterium sp.]MDD5149710.1 tetratricopeptide repeat-containing sensor histidine kinase [Flavobacterium sp.]